MADQAGIINSTAGTIVPVNNALVETSPGVWTLQAAAPGYVPESRTISTTAPLTGGGDLSANRTIAMPAATALADGYMTAAQAATVAAAVTNGSSAGGDLSGTYPNPNVIAIRLQATNKQGAPITKGQVVYVYSGGSQKTFVRLAKADSGITSHTTLGMVADSSIADNAEGWVMVTGALTGINTAALTEGQLFYLSATIAGGYTSAIPTAPNHRVTLGICTASHSTHGAVTLLVRPGTDLSELDDTAISALASGDLLRYDGTAWANYPGATLLAPYLLKAGDTMSGNLILGSGASLRLTGGASSGQGNIQLGAAASPFWDTNMLYCDATNRTMGLLCGSTPAAVASNGPWMLQRGNTYAAIANQRGLLAFAAGNPAGAKAGLDGRIVFLTGADQTRLTITELGAIQVSVSLAIGASGTPLSQVKIYTPSLTPAAVSAGAPAEQTFPVAGLATTDTVTVNPPGAAVLSARVSAADTLAIAFAPPASGSYTPPAGTYRVLAVRS